jgi:hypothetical protein
LVWKFHIPFKGALSPDNSEMNLGAVSFSQLYELYKGMICLLQTELQIKS